MATSYSTSTSSSATAPFLVTATDNSSCAQVPISRTDSSDIAEDLLSFDGVVCSSPTHTTSAQLPDCPKVSACTPSGSDIGQRKNLVLHLSASSPALASTPERNVEAELRDLVDNLVRKKTDTQRTLADENASLREEVASLKQALLQASSRPGSETAAMIAALEQERTLRQNAEELHTATGKYLAEQLDCISRQKRLLEAEFRDFTRGHDFWKAKAIAALERCETLEAENLQVKTQLNGLARKQSSAVAEQVSYVLREVAEERDRLRQLEELGQPSLGKTCSRTRRL